MKNKKRQRVVLLSMTVTLLLAGCQNKQAVSVATATAAQAQQQLEIVAWGEIKYSSIYQLNIDFPATVETILVNEGDLLQKEDRLAILDTLEFDQTIAKLEDKRNAIEAALSGTYQDTAGIQAQISQTQKDMATAQRDVNNYQALFATGSVSEDTVIQATNQLNAYKTNLQVLEVQLAQMNKSNTSNVDQQASELSATLKDLQIYQNKKTKHYLKDDVLICNLDSAIVKNIKVDNGSLLGSSAVTVMELIDVDSIYLNAEVEEENVKDILPSSVVRIVPTMNPELELTGTVEKIAAMAIEKDGNRIINIRIHVNDPELILKPGYTSDVYFARQGAQN